MSRLKVPNLSSVSTGVTATLTAGGTTVTWSADPHLPTVASPDILAVVLLPNTSGAEVIYITAHTAGATTSTCIRLAEPMPFGASTAAAISAGAWAHAATVPDLTANFGGGSLLGLATYTAAADGTAYTLAGSASALVDADATNLAVTFTTPPSGRVVVRLTGSVQGNGANGFVGVREGTTTLATGLAAGSATNSNLTRDFLITGLVPGSQHTYKFAGAVLSMYGGPTFGPFTIEVYDASAGGQGVGAASGVLRGDAGWTPVTYQNAWVDSGQPVGFRKDAMGYVHLHGKMAGGTGGTVAFTLPTGYRPEQSSDVPTDAWNGSLAQTRLTLGPDGTVKPDITPGAPTGNWVNLEGITFLAAGETGQLHDGGGTGGVVTPLLGLTSYNPASIGLTTAPIQAGLAAVDSTNLAVTFTAPASGRVLVTLNAEAVAQSTGGVLYWGVLEGTTPVGTVAGGAETAYAVSSQTNTTPSRSFLVTDLTPGSQHTYLFAHRAATTTAGTQYGGGTPAIIKVEDAGIGTAGTNLASPVNLLGITSYNPASLTTYSIAVTTPTDLDATNLVCTFTAPQSGRVLVRLQALGFGNSAGSGYLNWMLREGTTVVNSGTSPQVASGTTAVYATADFLITGLTPGSVHTYKWAQAMGAAVAGGTYAGGAAGPATMEVLDATVGLGGSGALVNSNKLALPVTYAAAADGATYTVAVGTALADVDATNLDVTFTAPPSGKVVIRTGAVIAAGASGVVFTGLREGTTVVAGPSLATNAAAETYVGQRFYVTGLTPGSVHTYKLAAYATTAAGSIFTGPTNGQVMLEVEDAAVAAAGISVPSGTSVPLVAAPTGVAATDTAVVQAALTAGGGRFPAGTYAINATLTNVTGTFVRGAGSLTIFNYTGAAAAVSFAGATDCDWDDLTIQTPVAGAAVIGIDLGDYAERNRLGPNLRLVGGAITAGQIGIRGLATAVIAWNRLGCKVDTYDTGLKLDTTGATAEANANDLSGLQIHNSTTPIVFGKASENVGWGVQCDTFTGASLTFNGGAQCNNNQISGRFEGGQAGSQAWSIGAGCVGTFITGYDNCATASVDNGTASIILANSAQKFPALTLPHLLGGGATPTAAIGTGGGSTGAVNSITGTDLAGSIIVTPGGVGIAAGQLAVVTFAAAYANPPRGVVVSPGNATAAASVPYVVYQVSATLFAIGVLNAPAAAAHEFNWVCIF